MSRDAYEEALRHFVSVLERITKEKWGEHGLGEWTIRNLIGHAPRAMLTIETYTAKPSSKPVMGYNVSALDGDRAALDIANPTELDVAVPKTALAGGDRASLPKRRDARATAHSSLWPSTGNRSFPAISTSYRSDL
jgi:hypothetical protein